MSAPSAIAPGGSSLISHAHRNGLGELANNREFHTLMDSLAEKDGATKKADSRESSSFSMTKPSAAGSLTLSSPLRNDSGAPAQAGAVVYDSPAQTNADRAAVARSSAESNFTNRLGLELQSLSFPEQANAILQPGEGHGGVTPSASSVMPSNSHEDSISAAFSSVADEMQLRVTGATSHFDSGLVVAGQATAQSKATAIPSLDQGGVETNGHEELISTAFSAVADEMQLRVTRATSHFDSGPVDAGQATSRPKTTAAPSLDQEGMETAAASLASAADAAPHASVDARSSNGASPVPSNESASPLALVFADVLLSLVPQALCQAVETLQPAPAQSTSAALSSAAPLPHASGAITRVLEIQLSPSGLGSLLVKMKLSEGALSVVIEASKPTTLNAVEIARHDIIERLAATNQTAASLEVRPLRLSQTQSEDASAGSSGPATRDESRGHQSDAGQTPPDRKRGRETFPAQDKSPLGGARHFVL
jgi:hypothetical protein